MPKDFKVGNQEIRVMGDEVYIRSDFGGDITVMTKDEIREIALVIDQPAPVTILIQRDSEGAYISRGEIAALLAKKAEDAGFCVTLMHGGKEQAYSVALWADEDHKIFVGYVVGDGS